MAKTPYRATLIACIQFLPINIYTYTTREPPSSTTPTRNFHQPGDGSYTTVVDRNHTGDKPCPYVLMTKPPISLLKPRKVPSTSMNGSAMVGQSCFRIRKTSLPSAPPNSATCPAYSPNSQSEAARLSG